MNTFTVRVENWNTRSGAVRKVVVRDTRGTFHGATNFRGSVIEALAAARASN